VLAVAIDASGSILHAGSDRDAVNAVGVDLGNLAVALTAGLRNVPMIDAGAFVARRINIVIAVTAVAVGSLFVAGSDGTAVNALLIRLNGVRDGNFVA